MSRSIAIGAVISALVASPAGAAAIAFSEPVIYPTGSVGGPGPGATTTIAEDFDGDGHVDVLITDWWGSGPRLLRNQGDGTFGPAVTVASAAGVGSLASGDLDGDGDLDVVGRTGWSLQILVNAGDGTFSVGGSYPTFENAQQAVAVGDLDGDGALDVVTTTPSGILVLLNDGAGTFRSGPTTNVFGLFSDLAVADLDGDAHLDLLVADATPLVQQIRTLRGTGDGSFVSVGGGPVSFGPESILASDLDGDGDDDAISVDSFSIFENLNRFSITVLLNDGEGRLVRAQTVATGNGPVSGAAADLDGDGDIDAAVSAVIDGTVTVYRNNGSGNLTEDGRHTATPFPQTPATADFDGDGRADLAVPGAGQLAVLFGRP